MPHMKADTAREAVVRYCQMVSASRVFHCHMLQHMIPPVIP